MEWVQGMNEAVNYIEEHILEEPDLNELGKLAGCSAHHTTANYVKNDAE